MGLFDWFAAELACLACGKPTPPGGATGAQTKLHPSPRQNYLRVGDELPVTPDSAEDARYTVLQPAAGEVRILQRWECSSCGDAAQWLEVVVEAERIAEIRAVRFEPALLARAHYIEDESLLAAAAGLPGAPPRLDDPQVALALLRRSAGMPVKTIAAGEITLEASALPGEGGAAFSLALKAAAPRDAVVAEVLAAAWQRGPDTLIAAMEERSGHGEGEPLGYAYHDPRAESPIPEGTVRVFSMEAERFVPERDFEALILGLLHFHLETAARLHVSGAVEGTLRTWLGRRG